MTIIEAIEKRHSVRRYLQKEITAEHRLQLENFITEINTESGLNFKLVFSDKKAFGGAFAKYGRFENVCNYIVVKGKRQNGFSEKCGYYGEKIVIFAQSIGLNTCWVGLHYKKNPLTFDIKKGEKLNLVIAIGYGKNSGAKRKSKLVEKVSNYKTGDPEWFLNGVKSALKAPTAINRQGFYFKLLKDNTVKLKARFGPFYKTDKGIVKYHFEQSAGLDNFSWK